MAQEQDTLQNRARALLAQLTLEEKTSLLSGADCWHTRPIPRVGLEPLTLMDGPHGLRKQIGATDNLGIGDSVPAVCYPTASALACSFDRDLLYRVGKAIGENCVQEDVQIILGPGVNQKRSPLCGRNFEYFSEDATLTGELAASMIQGIQSTGTQASLKHFAVNNQEKNRMTISVAVDERALRETYLRAFEIAVKKGQPGTVMCSYNRLDEEYCGESQRLLTDILRAEWGFQGAVVSDWGAVHDRVACVRTGMDLEMPGNGGINDQKVLKAVREGQLSEQELDRVVLRILECALRGADAKQPRASFDPAQRHALAIEAAEQSAVLLKNENQLLPGSASQQIAVIGEFARMPRYQGAGSSKIHPIQVDTPLAAFQARGMDVDFAPGYRLQTGGTYNPAQENQLMDEACKAAKNKDIVYLFIGLPEGYESEGFDRSHLQLPPEQNRLVSAVCAVNPQVAVILIGGAPVELPWREQVSAILLPYLAGEGMGTAVVNLLLGDACPSGRLAETWPLSLRDTPSYHIFPGDRLHVQYRESIYIGYRYYEKAGVPVCYPFGYGLSYTTFAYSDLVVDTALLPSGGPLHLQFTVRNTGDREGQESVLVFVTPPEGAIFRPVRELRTFTKLALAPGECATVCLSLRTEEWGYYNTKTNGWYTPAGTYRIGIGANSGDALSASVTLQTPAQPENDLRTVAPAYYALPKEPLRIPDADFSALYGKPIPPPAPKPARPYTMENTIDDIQHTLMGKVILLLVRQIERKAKQTEEGQEGMLVATIREMPLFGLLASADGMITQTMAEGILDWLNGHRLRGVKKLLRR